MSLSHLIAPAVIAVWSGMLACEFRDFDWRESDGPIKGMLFCVGAFGASVMFAVFAVNLYIYLFES